MNVRAALHPGKPARRWFAVAKPVGSIACCIALAGWAFAKVDLEKALAIATPRLLIACLVGSVCIAATAWLQASRWWRIARAVGAPLDKSTALRATLLSYFLLAVSPSTLVADGARIVSQRQRGSNWTHAAQSVLMDRVFGLVTLMLCAVVGLPLLYAQVPVLGLTLGAPIGVATVALVASALILRQRIPRAWLRRQIVRRTARAFHAVRRILSDSTVLVTAFMFSLVIVALSLTAFALIGVAVAARVDAVAILTLYPAVLLLSVLPFSVGGWGVREVSLVGLYPYLGTSPEKALAVSVTFGIAILGAGILCLLARALLAPPHPVTPHVSDAEARG